tara:strand:+ start:6970 stop:9255 length:2286 start_codon:yes stop_codon:yes gene_type:complete
MAKTKIGTKLLATDAISTAKLATSAVTRDKIASGSVQVGHLDLFQDRNDVAHLDDTDVLIVSASKGNSGGMRTVTFAHLKAAVSASNAAVGNEGHIQFHGTGGTNAMDAISKIRTDGVHLTASDGGKVVFAYTAISGSTGEIFADAKTSLTLNAKTTLTFNINGSDELELNASTLQPAADGGLNLGAAGRKFNNAYVATVSGSGTSTLHKLDVDALAARKVTATVISGSGTSTFHKLDVDDATFNVIKAINISGSGTAQIHKVDVDEGTFNRAIATVVSGSGTSLFHKIDGDEGDFRKAVATVVTSSGTSLFHKIDGDEGDFRKVVATNITSSGTSNLHNVTADELSGSSGKFRKLVVDILDARTYKSSITTSEHFEIVSKQIIAATSGSAGDALEGAGLQIGGTAGSGSAGVASVILGDAGSGAGSDLLFKIGSTQGLSLSSNGGRKSDAVLFGVSGTLSASVGIFQELDVAKGLTAKSFSGSSGTFHTLSGTIVQYHEIDADQASILDLDGTSATFTVVSGTTVNATTVDADIATINDLDGTSATFTGIISGSTVDAHTLDADKAEVRDLDVTNAISGSGTATIHKVTSDVVSGSVLTAHNVDTDKLSVGVIVTNDVVKAANLNRDIVLDIDNGNGGLNFANGVLSIGQRRQVFAQHISTGSLANSISMTEGSGSLYTTASLATDAAGNPTIIMSGSEMVYLNGVLLIPAPATQRPPKDGDYTIDYNSASGPVTIELHETLSMDFDDILIVQYLSGTIS